MADAEISGRARVGRWPLWGGCEMMTGYFSKRNGNGIRISAVAKPVGVRAQQWARCLSRLLWIGATACTLAAQTVTVRATRVSDQPLLSPSAGDASAGIFNPAAARIGSKTILLTRDQDKAGTSRIGYAESADGIHFTHSAEPVLKPEAPYELNGGVEDPRLVKINDLWYLTYTGYNKKDAQLCLATSTDLKHWERKGVILPAYKGTWNTRWTKSGAIVPEQINGKWWMYYLGTANGHDSMGLAVSDDLLHWKDATAHPVLPQRMGAFDERVMEPGPAPIVTPQGILLLYNGADHNLVYGPGWVLFDKHDPSKVLARSDVPFLKPELEWEKVGQVPNVIFLEGAVLRTMDGALISHHNWSRSQISLMGYYGAADTRIGATKIDIDLQSQYH
jgi:predicted GH43/DUF377 family glycosyl hydrolase